MNKLHKIIYLVIIALFLSVSPVLSQEIVNVTSKQIGEKLTIGYDIQGEKLGQQFSISPFYSLDAGKTFFPIKSAIGNVGPNVPGGKNQIIVWDVLKDMKELNGNVMFKLVADTKSLVPTQEEFSKMVFQIESFHHLDNNKIELLLSITNNGGKRDLKMINGLITITDFKKYKYDAQSGKLGEVIGSERYSTPQRAINSGETVKASFVFERIPGDLDRAMRLDLGIEFLTYDGYGLSLEIGKLQFRDLPVTFTKTVGLNVEVAKKFETATSPIAYTIKKEEIKDATPPELTITEPADIPLVNSGATRGRPYAQSSIGMDDKRLRAIGAGEEYTVSEKNIIVKGKAADESGIYEVIINGKDAKIGDDGSFNADVLLHVGKNEVVIRATDIRQNSVEKKFFVIRKEGQVAKGETEELDIIFDEQKKMPKYYALIMGASDYQDESVSDLAQPVNDAQKLYEVLTTNYTFNPQDIIFLKNPTREQMINELDRLTRRITKNDNLLVFYAGHGFWDKETEFGYWIPTDSKITSTANWLANSQIKDYVAAIKSKHTLLIADACFGGSIFLNRKAFAEGSDAANKLYDAPSRKAMTSGSLTEVPDRSVFLEYLVKRLNENTKNYLSAEELFGSFKNIVMSSSPVTPLYGEIKGTGDEGGDFIFVKK